MQDGLSPLLIEALESRLLLSGVLSYHWVGPPPIFLYHESGVSSSDPTWGPHDSGESVTFQVFGLPGHNELKVEIGARVNVACTDTDFNEELDGPGGGGLFEPGPCWETEVILDGQVFNEAGIFLIPHTDEVLTATVTMTYTGTGSASSADWYFQSAKVTRFTPTVGMSARDTAVEGTASYPPDQEPGFSLTRIGDNQLAPLVVLLGGPSNSSTADPDADYEPLPTEVTIPAGEADLFVPLDVFNDEEIEWTETIRDYEVLDGDVYDVGASSSADLLIKDDDPVDIVADGLPEELEDPGYNETDPGLFLPINDDDDNGNLVPDHLDPLVNLAADDDLKEVRVRFQDEDKAGAEVFLVLINPARFRVWDDSGALLLGGGPVGETEVQLSPSQDGPEMILYVEAIAPLLGSPPVIGGLSLQAIDWPHDLDPNSTTEQPVRPGRLSDSADALRLVAFEPRIKAVAFDATDESHRYPVHRDDTGEAYSTPEWVDQNLDGIPESQHPAAYRRESTMLLIASLDWAGAPGQNDIVVVGNGPGGYDFYARTNWDDPNDLYSTLTLADGDLSFVDSAAGPFPNWIDHFDTFDIAWSVSPDGGATWIPAGMTKNQVYTLLEAPKADVLRHTAAHMASKYAKGRSQALDVAAAIRDGVHADIPYDPGDGVINSDPLTMYGGGGQVCADHANLTTLLGRSIGLDATTVMIWGGVSYNNTATHRDTWYSSSAPATFGATLNVSSGATSFNFSYHAVSEMNGVYEDSALGRRGVTATALGAGATLFGETVRVLYKATGEQITETTFDAFDQVWF